MNVKWSVLIGLAAAVLAGCESPQTGAPSPPPGPAEETIQAPMGRVRVAATNIMSGRGYFLTPVGTDTLLFDRTSDFGSGVKYDFLLSKDAYRRVRMRLIPVGAATRVTAEPSLVTNRGTAFEKEDADHSGSAYKVMREILGKIRAEAQAGG